MYKHNHSEEGVFTDVNVENNYVSNYLYLTYKIIYNIHVSNNVYSCFVTTQNRMVELRNAQVGSSNPLSEREIVTNVLGERRGHIRGIGRIVSCSSSSTSRSNAQSRPSQRLYTQAEVDAMHATQRDEIRTEIREEVQRETRAEVQRETRAIYEALRQAGINVNFPSSSQRSPGTDLADNEDFSD